MDNASKALLMAAGILIAIAIMGIAMSMINSARSFVSTTVEEEFALEVSRHNRFFEGYSYSEVLNGIDVVNIKNKINSLNEDFDEGLTILSSRFRDNIGTVAPELFGEDRSYYFLRNRYTYEYSVDSSGIITGITIQKVS